MEARVKQINSLTHSKDKALTFVNYSISSESNEDINNEDIKIPSISIKSNNYKSLSNRIIESDCIALSTLKPKQDLNIEQQLPVLCRNCKLFLFYIEEKGYEQKDVYEEILLNIHPSLNDKLINSENIKSETLAVNIVDMENKDIIVQLISLFCFVCRNIIGFKTLKNEVSYCIITNI